MYSLSLLACLSVQGAPDFWREAPPAVFNTRTVGAALLDLNQDGNAEYLRLGITPGTTEGTLGITIGSPYGPVGAELCRFPTFYPQSIGVQDIDADGFDDIFVVHRRIVGGTPPVLQVVPTVSLYLHDSNSTGDCTSAFRTTRFDSSQGSEFAAFGDFDQDGVLDVASVGRAHRLYYQTGLGMVGGVPHYSSQWFDVSAGAAQTAGVPGAFEFGFASDLEVGDFDGDGTDDIAVSATTAAGGGVHVYFQRPAGFVYQRITFTGSGGGILGATSLAHGDFDQDGWMDFAATIATIELQVFTNAGPTPGSLAPNQALGVVVVPSNGVGVGAGELQAADLDLDGTTDLVLFDPAANAVAVAYNRNTAIPGAFDSSEVIFLQVQGSALWEISLADVDRDGDVDVAASFLLSQSMEMLFGERVPNLRKARGTALLRGSHVQGTHLSTFVPDGDELVQDSSAFAQPGVPYRLASRLKFQTPPGFGENVRIRLHDRTSGQGVSGSLGLRNVLTGKTVWIAGYSPATSLQDLVFDVPGASRYVAGDGQLDLVWSHESLLGSFRSQLEQVSVELIP